VDAAAHPGHALDETLLVVPADEVRLSVPGHEGVMGFEIAYGSGGVVAGQVADIGLIPSHQGAEAVLVDLVFGPLEPLCA